MKAQTVGRGCISADCCCIKFDPDHDPMYCCKQYLRATEHEIRSAKSFTIFHFIGHSRILITSFESFSKLCHLFLFFSRLIIFLQNRMSTTRGKFTIFAPLYRSLIVKKYLQKVTPI